MWYCRNIEYLLPLVLVEVWFSCFKRKLVDSCVKFEVLLKELVT